MSHLPLAASNETKYLYNGKELQDDQIGGIKLDWYDYGARFYDAALARFPTIDPKAEEYNFQTPYCYAANNPIIYVDKNGEGPGLAIAGALIGGVYDFGSQVAVGMVSGQSFGDAVSNVDYADVLISAGEGALAGMTNGASLLITTTASNALQAGIDVNINGDGITGNTVVGGINGGEQKSLKAAGVEMGAATATSMIPGGEKIVKALGSDKVLKQATSNLNAASKNLSKSNKNITNADPSCKAASSNESFKSFSAAKSNYNTAKTMNGVNNNKVGMGVLKYTDKVSGTVQKSFIQNNLNEYLSGEN